MQYIAQYVAYVSIEIMNHEESFNAEIAVNAAFLSKRVYDFHLLINKQADKVYKNKGIIFPVATSSTVLFLSTIDSASLAQIARALDHPHQLIAQRVKALLKLELIEGTQDSKDKRRTLYHLTQTGLIQSQLLNDYCKEAADAFNSLSKEVGVDLHVTLNKACTALERTPFSERFPSGKK